MASSTSELRVGPKAHAIRESAVAYRALDDGRELSVYRMFPGQHRLCIGPQGDMTYDDAYCYHALSDVLPVVAEWDGNGDPPGRWYRHIGSGRRREFDAEGNVVREEIRP